MSPLPGAKSGMRIIPVIDLLDGLAVHARRGQRADYRPVATPLCPDPDPQAVLRAYLSLHPFDTVYLADLNAIQDNGDNDAVVRTLMAACPGIEFWLDAGAETLERCAPRLRPVLGTESGVTPEYLGKARKMEPILSLDFAATGLLGTPELLHHPESWPDDVILMSLDKVGSEAGPALRLCREMHALCGGRKRLYLAGGARDAGDVQRASESGAAGLLIATALHAGTLDLAALPVH